MASTNFINECKNRANQNRLGKIVLIDDNIDINNSNNLKKYTVENSCYVNGNIIGTIFLKKLTGEFIGLSNSVDLIDKKINVQAGVKYANATTEYVNLGKYIVERPKNIQTADKDKITAYDYLSDKIDEEYVCNINYASGNKTVQDLYIDVCNQLNLTPVTTTFLNCNIPIQSNPFKNHEKNRTVLQAIATVACSFVTIDVDIDKIDLSWLSASNSPEYTFQKNDYSILEGGKITYGPINSVTIKNSQIDDENVTQTDSESISLYGEHSIVISEDYILYNTALRQQAITQIFNRLDGLKYVDCKLTTYYGKPFMKIGTKIRVTTDNGYFDTYVLSHSFGYDGSFASEISSPALTDQEIKTKQNRSLGKLLSDTQIEINKQQQQITANVTSIQQVTQKANTLETNLNTTNSNLATTNTNLNNLQTQVNGISADFDDFYDNEYIQSIDNLQSQIDGQIQFWNGPDIPTINNYPTNQWTTEADKNNHRADIYTVIEDVQGELKQGKSYRFDKVNNVWQWIELTDNELSAVQAIANEANNRSKANASDITVLQEQDATFQMNLNSIDARVTNNETTIQEIIDTEDEKTGNPITTEEALASKLLDFEIYGNSYKSEEIIPDEYTQVSYIESSGTQYIDTGFIPNSNTKVEISISTKSISGDANRSIFGSRTNATSNHYGFTIGGNNCWWNGYGSTNGNTAVSVTSDTFYEIVKNKNVTTVNGIQLTSATAQTFTCPGNLYLFGMNQNGITFKSSIKLYSCRIYDNGTLIRDFKPCVRNSDGVIGLLDEVNDVFYENAGTGTFEKGKEIVNLCDNLHYLKAYIFESQNKISYDENSRLKYAHVPKNTDLYVAKSTPTNRYRIALMNTVPAGEAPIGPVVFNADNKNVLSTIINSGNYEYVAIQYSNSAEDTNIEVYEIYSDSSNNNLNNNQSYAITIENVTGNCNLKINNQNYEINLGKNYINNLVLYGTNNGITPNYNNSNKVIGFTGKATSSYVSLANINDLNITAGQYNLKINEIKSYRIILRLYTDSTNYSEVSLNANTLNTIINVTNTIVSIRIMINTTKNTTYNETFKLNFSSTSDIELCKIGDYKDILRKSTGKNLFDKDNANKLNGYINSAGTIISETNNKTLYIPCKSNTTYTISKIPSTRFGIATYNSVPQINSSTSNFIRNNSASNLTITTGANDNYLAVWYFNNNTDTLTEEQILESIQIEKGSQATDIEPFGKDVWYKFKKINKISSYNGETITTDYISTTDGLDIGATVYYVLENSTYEIIENQELIDNLNSIELFEGINNVSFESNVDTEFMIKYLLKTPFTDNYMTRTETEAEINIKANQILEKVQEVSDETTSINQRVQNLSETTSTISTNLNNNYQTADATNAQIQTTKDDITQIQSQISEVRQSLTDFNISLSTMSGTLNNMSYNFNTDRLKIAKTNDPINSELSNQGVKIYNYSTLSAIFTNKGSGIDKLIVTGTAQIGYLKIVKSYKNNKKCTTIHVLNQLIEDLEDLESDN